MIPIFIIDIAVDCMKSDMWQTMLLCTPAENTSTCQMKRGLSLSMHALSVKE